MMDFPKGGLGDDQATCCPPFCHQGFVPPAGYTPEMTTEITEGVFDQIGGEEAPVQGRRHLQGKSRFEILFGFKVRLMCFCGLVFEEGFQFLEDFLGSLEALSLAQAGKEGRKAANDFEISSKLTEIMLLTNIAVASQRAIYEVWRIRVVESVMPGRCVRRLPPRL